MTDDFKYEEEIMKFWEEKGIYKKAKEKNEGNKPFNHIDGPPYPTGEPHLGHFRNYTIKDSVLRFKRLMGYDVYARDGYDVHGLPVENKVQAKLGLKTVAQLKEFGEENFVAECKTYVAEIIDLMKGFRNRMGLWMDRVPYTTANPQYLSYAWEFFKAAEKKGLLYKDYRTVGWCPHDETTLSDYEIKDTYKEIVDPSIYVKYPLRKDSLTTTYQESVVIWTTTPWTLESNMLVAVNPKFSYSYCLVELNGKQEVLILAESLVEKVIDTLSKQNEIKLVEVIKTVLGAELLGKKYDHIYGKVTESQIEFLKNESEHKNIHSIVEADFVTLDEGDDIIAKLEKKGSYKHSNKEDAKLEETKEIKSDLPKKKAKSEGTGIVHIAPGHGFDDYNVGKKYNVPIFCPVGPNGKMTEGKYKGMYFKDADKPAIDYLREQGFLLSFTEKSHRYPCCWRCKTPIVYRAADQWWIRRSEMTEGIIKENQNVKWMPKAARSVFDNLMKGAGDWAISRQRYWGIPLPIFECEETKDYKVFGNKEELEAAIGHELEDIHRDNLKNLEIVENGNVYKAVPFITDVWFESGCASFASHFDEGLDFNQIIEKYYPMTWITEGEDQIRGWFSSLFTVGYMLTGKAPYNEVLFQRFVMDKNGQKMSKSVGNGVTAYECLDKWGADRSRFYLLTKTAPSEQVNFVEEEFTQVDGFFNTLENLTKFMNGYLEEYDVKIPTLNIANLNVEDKWILYKLSRTIGTFTRHFENFEINKAVKEVENFIVNDLSKVYLKLVKERTGERDEDLVIIFKRILKEILIMMSPVIPFKTEELYQNLNLDGKKESIFLENFSTVDELIIKEVESKKIDENFEIAQHVIQAVLNAREKAKIGVRWPLPEINITSHNDSLSTELEVFEKLIKQLTNIKKINYSMEGIKMSYTVKPSFQGLKSDDSVENMSDSIKVINKNKNQISLDIENGEVVGTYDDVNVDLEKHLIKEIVLSSDLISSDFSGGNVILHTTQDEILLEEGYVREITRRIQSLRKDLGLEKNDEISLSFAGTDEYFIEIIGNWESFILKKVGASEVLLKELTQKQEFTIKEKKLIVGISKN